MAIASLNKFTVPLTTTTAASAQGMLMPKLKYRFRVSFTSFGASSLTTELTKQVKSFTRPKPTFDNITLDVYNSRINLLGKLKWESTTCVIRDDAVGNVSKLVGEQLQKQFDFAEQSSAASGADYKFVTLLEMLDGGNGANAPTVLETWELYGCMLTGVDYGEADYGSNDPFELSLTIMYDNAVQSPVGTGVGTSVGRTLGTAATA